MPASLLPRAIAGATAGLAATAAMTGVLVPSERVGVMPGQPPRMIVDRLLPDLDDRTADRVALVAHLAYGAGAGVLFALVTRRRRTRASTGLLYGLAVWLAGYEGWLPALGVLPPAHRDHRGRAVTVLVAHLVYGRALARARRGA